MSVRRKMRLASLVMFGIAVVFVLCAISCPTLGSTIVIGSFRFGAEQWRICYLLYTLAMTGLFAGSFWVKK